MGLSLWRLRNRVFEDAHLTFSSKKPQVQAMMATVSAVLDSLDSLIMSATSSILRENFSKFFVV